MKKIFFILLTLIILSGCTIAPNKITEKDMTNNNSEKINQIDEREDGLSPEMNTEDSSEVEKKENNNQTQLEDLAVQFNTALFKTNLGNIKVKLYAQESPLTVNNFLDLANKGFYDKTKFHRVIKDFMIQGGDPNSKDDDWSNDGMGGPDYKFQDEFNSHKLMRGSLAMANSGPNTNGSQFFIVTAPATSWLDGVHTNFGYVTEGMEIIDKIEEVEVNENAHPLRDIIVENIELLSE